MDRQTALLELATAHAVALRLHEAGAGDEAVAQALGIPVTSVAGLLRVAGAKLAALLGPEDQDADLP
jgi:hypothetical protein